MFIRAPTILILVKVFLIINNPMVFLYEYRAAYKNKMEFNLTEANIIMKLMHQGTNNYHTYSSEMKL